MCCVSWSQNLTASRARIQLLRLMVRTVCGMPHGPSHAVVSIWSLRVQQSIRRARALYQIRRVVGALQCGAQARVLRIWQRNLAVSLHQIRSLRSSFRMVFLRLQCNAMRMWHHNMSESNRAVQERLLKHVSQVK